MCENVVNISQIHKGLVMNKGNDRTNRYTEPTTS